MKKVMINFFLMLFLSISLLNAQGTLKLHLWDNLSPQDDPTLNAKNIAGLLYYTANATATGTGKFLMFEVGWGSKWGENNASLNTVGTLDYNGLDGSVSVTNGYYYTFNFPGNPTGTDNDNYAILETSQMPRTITNVSDNYSGAGNDVVVTITLSGVKCAEEKVFVRYTKDGWTNSTFVETSSGTNPYYATIPGADVTGQINNQYYVLTSTVIPTHSTADLLTINYANNGGSNWTLPVELSTFTAQYLAGKPLLYWTTQSETDNMGWFVYRNQVEDFTCATKVSGMIEGHGTTTQAQSYIYEDVITNPQVGDVYYYWLESVDYSGTIHHFDKVAMITIPETNDPNPNVTPPQVYDLLASPNPFNESTKISFTLTQSAMVDVAIYDVKGALVKSFNSLHITADDLVSLQWDGKDENGKSLSNGIYLYSVKVNGQDYATKQVILMK